LQKLTEGSSSLPPDARWEGSYAMLGCPFPDSGHLQKH
jgi:hypothetical protein